MPECGVLDFRADWAILLERCCKFALVLNHLIYLADSLLAVSQVGIEVVADGPVAGTRWLRWNVQSVARIRASSQQDHQA